MLRNENYQNMLNINKYLEHEHGILILILMNEWRVIGSVYDHTTEKEMYVNLTDEVVEDHEVVNQKMTVQMEINHLLVTMEHVMLQVEDEMMKK